MSEEISRGRDEGPEPRPPAARTDSTRGPGARRRERLAHGFGETSYRLYTALLKRYQRGR